MPIDESIQHQMARDQIVSHYEGFAKNPFTRQWRGRIAREIIECKSGFQWCKDAAQIGALQARITALEWALSLDSIVYQEKLDDLDAQEAARLRADAELAEGNRQDRVPGAEQRWDDDLRWDTPTFLSGIPGPPVPQVSRVDRARHETAAGEDAGDEGDGGSPDGDAT